jgi:hypothetical protein
VAVAVLGTEVNDGAAPHSVADARPTDLGMENNGWAAPRGVGGEGCVDLLLDGGMFFIAQWVDQRQERHPGNGGTKGGCYSRAVAENGRWVSCGLLNRDQVLNASGLSPCASNRCAVWSSVFRKHLHYA